MKWLYLPLFAFILLFSGPIYRLFTLDSERKFSNRDSALLAPNPLTEQEAVIQAYSARAYSWRGAFSVHTWLAIKEKNSSSYTTYQVIGWGYSKGHEVRTIRTEIPDRNWFGAAPSLLLDIRGIEAEKLIPKIQQAANDYPYAYNYALWPGPNSNTFVAYIGRKVPELKLALPADAVGKDYPSDGRFFMKAPSGTGYQISFYGLFGMLFAKREGFELNILGLVIGINPFQLTISLPGFGSFG